MRRSQAARSRRERDVRAQAGRGAARYSLGIGTPPGIGTVVNAKNCALPTKIIKMIV